MISTEFIMQYKGTDLSKNICVIFFGFLEYFVLHFSSFDTDMHVCTYLWIVLNHHRKVLHMKQFPNL